MEHIFIALVLTVITLGLLMKFAPGLFANKSTDDSNVEKKNDK